MTEKHPASASQLTHTNQPIHTNSIDSFRMIAAFLIIAIHTGPLCSVSETADFLFTYCFARIGVPFFLMTTGYFVLAPCYLSHFKRSVKLKRFLVKTLTLYLAATLLYLPINLYAGHLSFHPGTLLKDLLFDGTFYHLWYLPAALLGCLFLVCLLKCLPLLAVAVITLLLYVTGLFGDSYYNIISELPAAAAFYNVLFGISSYTRNGIFYAPVFLLMGLLIRRYKKEFSRPLLILCFSLSLLCMLAEGYFSFINKLQRHNSMYIFLLPCMFFLFQLLLSRPGPCAKLLRNLSLLIYILHPVSIIAVRGMAKISGLSAILVENSVIHYLCVCLLTLLLSGGLLKGKELLCTKKDVPGLN